MFYEKELAFLINSLCKCRVQALLLRHGEYASSRTDAGLRHRLGLDNDYAKFFEKHLLQIQPNTIYKLSDAFFCHYLFLHLPVDDRVLFIGPYLSEDISRQRMMELAEHIGIPPQHFRRLETYYSGVPVLLDDHAAFAMLDTFGETLWGDETAFSFVDINRELSGDLSPLAAGSIPEDIPQDMAVLEQRYAYENELIQAVAQGLTHKAEVLFSSFSQSAFEQRLTDPVRNLKNYAIIMNTLLRKAAEKGGVHPLYLDQTSTDFARRIELTASPGTVRELMTDMFRAYCRLVKTRAINHYSPPVQKLIAGIDTDLAGDLSLSNLAAAQGLNASYLSALFRRETGETVTQHINRKRIQQAIHLLSSTHLQIQTVAQHCGIPDVNYFSKLFKKHTGKTPREYRNALTPTDTAN